VPCAPVHLFGSIPHHAVEAQPLMRRLYAGEGHPPHPRVDLSDDMAGTLNWHLQHQGHGEGSNSWVNCLLRPSHGRVTRYTLPSSPRRPRGRAQTITHFLLKTLRCRHCIGSTWSWQVTGGPARLLSSGHKCGVSSTFNRNVEELASSRASTTRQASPSPINCPNVSSGVFGLHHPVAVKPPPLLLEIARNLKFLFISN
jgi:hypothetical protein